MHEGDKDIEIESLLGERLDTNDEKTREGEEMRRRERGEIGSRKILLIEIPRI